MQSSTYVHDSLDVSMREPYEMLEIKIRTNSALVHLIHECIVALWRRMINLAWLGKWIVMFGVFCG